MSDGSQQPPTGFGKTRWRALVVLGVAVGLVGLGLLDRWYERHKEGRFDRLILRTAARHHVDPALVKAVIWRESKFNPKVRGRVGEIGLMQIGPLAAQEWARTHARRDAFEGNLFEPETNLEVGTWYLRKLLTRYAHTDHPAPYALADYNAGRSNLLRWNKGAAETNSALFISQIGFPSTKEYVRAVLERSAQYQGDYGGHRRKALAEPRD
ncbi:MAG: lytic transglycosylase domain-containing protein [Verrucomicrobiia bacterium]